jgi:hypothetical protein
MTDLLAKDSIPSFSPFDTVDGKLWAQEFMRLFGDRLHEIDEALMTVWFCNAIMRGYDVTRIELTVQDE